MKKQYYTPSQLLQEPAVSEIFTRPQEIGLFSRLFAHKIHIIQTDRTKLIDKHSFLRLIQAISDFDSKDHIILP